MVSRRYITICREGWYFIFVLCFILGGAVLRQVNLLMALGGLMIGLLILNWRFVASTLRNLHARRLLPNRVCAGEIFTVDVIAENHRHWLDGWAITMEDTLCQLNGDERRTRSRVRAIVAHVRAGQSARSSYRCCLSRRGLYRFGPLRYSTRFPLGFIEGARVVQQSETLLVCPRLGRLTAHWEMLIEAAAAGDQRAQQRRGIFEGDYYGMRDWRTGDNRRWIHWRASAKLGDLKVREFEQNRNRDVALVLDLWQPQTASFQDQDNLETAISFAATAISDCCKRGSNPITFATSGLAEHCQTALTSTLFLYESLERLALIEGGSSTGLGDVLAQVSRKVSRGTPIVVISTRANDGSNQLATTEHEDEIHLQNALDRSIWIDVGGNRLSQFFELKLPTYENPDNNIVLAEAVV